VSPDQEEEEDRPPSGPDEKDEDQEWGPGDDEEEGEDGVGPGVGPAQPISHSHCLQAARQAIAELVGEEVTVKKDRKQIIWTVVASSQPILPLEEKTGIGLYGINLHCLPSSKLLAGTNLN